MVRTHPAIGFIGAGAMAGFLADGLLASGLPADALWICNRSDDLRLRRFAERGVHLTRDKAAVCTAVSTLFLLVKPKDAQVMLHELQGLIRPAHLMVSCMAGVPAAFIEASLGGEPHVLRAMPNIGSAVRASVTALAPGRYADEADAAAAAELLRAVGTVVPVAEGAMDAATALFGSGPAYVYLLMEALTGAATHLGLEGPQTAHLIVEMVLGAAQAAAASADAPAELRARVSSKGGTTMAAVDVFEASGFEALVAAAVQRAAARSRELGLAWGSSPS